MFFARVVECSQGGDFVYLSDLLAGLRRRWYAVLIGLAITGALLFGALKVTPVEYVAQSSILLIPPTKVEVTGGNPYLSLGGIQGAADVLARAMSGEEVSEEVAPSTGTATYTFQPDATTNAPMLVIEARDVSPEGAVATLGSLLIKAPQVLQELQVQVDAPATFQIQISVVTEDESATPDRKSLIRSAIVAVVAGIAITLFGTNLLDGYLLRRRARREGPEAPGSAGLPVSTSPPPPPPSKHSASGKPGPADGASDRPRRSGLRSPKSPNTGEPSS